MIIKIGTTHFKELQRHWYETLKDEGFEDIEKTTPLTVFLKQWHNSYYKTRFHPRTYQIKVRYYQLASQYCWENQFETEEQFQVWSLHADGVTVRGIAGRLKLKPCQVHSIISTTRKQMMKYWNRLMETELMEVS